MDGKELITKHTYQDIKIMKTKILLSIILLGFILGKVNSQVLLEIEAGLVNTGYNDVRIPGDGGTLFSLSEDLKADPEMYYRLRAGYAINRHTISLLYAPLEIESDGRIGKDISFAGEVFQANNPIEATYKFNSYRLTYRYDIIKRPKLDFGLGFTAKIRDAKIALSSAGTQAEKDNVGFVPIVNFRVHWRFAEKFGILLDGDALAAKQGRAEDVLLAFRYNFTEKIGIHAGYRILEGGADNDEVYSFALFHYASVGLGIVF